jgi:type I restriction enzyme R subunit
VSEYRLIEKPFLDQLAALGWEVVDHCPLIGEFTIPSVPSMSHRISFREVLLEQVFKEAVKAINLTEDGRPWLTDKQLDDLFQQISTLNNTSLVEANRIIYNYLRVITDEKLPLNVDLNELTGEQYPDVKLIDFQHPERNRFIAINQFRIDCPGRVKEQIRPDIVLFVNGLPMAVVECKEANPNVANPMFEAITQLLRYSNQREETLAAGLCEGEEKLFHYNALMIATTDEEARFGSLTANEDYYYEWKSVFPEKYQTFNPPLGITRSQETLIQGMLPKETFLDIIRNFTVFSTTEDKRWIKVVPRYQQYRAVTKIVERLRSNPTPEKRSGVVWHTQGSGKSLTMVFLIRKLRTCNDLKDYKVVMVNDRRDLEEQLGGTATLTGEKVNIIADSDTLKNDLATTSSNLNMVMIHKFLERESADLPESVREALGEQRLAQRFKDFGVVNPSDRVLILVDEAHRTQASDLGNNLFAAFPQATRLAFTGTPLITDRHKEKTHERFGAYIDKYRLQDAVKDGATVQILYEGKTSDTALKDKHEFDRKFENLFGRLSDEDLLKIKKKYGTTGDILEAEQRIEAIAKDLVQHYVENILPNGFKAQVVCHSKQSCIHYKTYIDKALCEFLETEKSKLPPDYDLIEKLQILKSAVIISSDGTNEKAVFTQIRKLSKDWDAVENFKKSFKPEEPLSGIAFLIVCDMLLTGFDAPIEQVMYIDKKVQEHNLLQAIARVNRVKKGKSKGYVVDYIGLTEYLRDALSIYASDDIDELLNDDNGFRDVLSELPVLESRFNRLIQLFEDHSVPQIKAFVQQEIKDTFEEVHILENILDKLVDLKFRADFEVFFKKFLQSMDVILPNEAANPYKIPSKRFGFILAKAKHRYKDESLSIAGAGEKIRKLINEHLISLGIDPKIPPTELIATNFVDQVEQNKTPKARASEMEHAIRKHCKVHLEEDPAFYQRMSEKLEALIEKMEDNWEQLYLALVDLREESIVGRNEVIDGVTIKASAFYDYVVQITYGKDEVPEDVLPALKEAINKIYDLFEKNIGISNFWSKPVEIERMKGDLSDIILISGIDALIGALEHIVTEITSLAKVRHKDIIS